MLTAVLPVEDRARFSEPEVTAVTDVVHHHFQERGIGRERGKVLARLGEMLLQVLLRHPEEGDLLQERGDNQHCEDTMRI